MIALPVSYHHGQLWFDHAVNSLKHSEEYDSGVYGMEAGVFIHQTILYWSTTALSGVNSLRELGFAHGSEYPSGFSHLFVLKPSTGSMIQPVLLRKCCQ